VITRARSLLLGRACRATRPGGEQGNALVEFVVLEVVLLVPLVYLVMTLARVQAGAFAAANAAREAGRAYVTAQTQESAVRRAEAAARIAFEDQGFSTGDARVRVTCDRSPCLRPDARVEVLGEVRVPLPLVPAFVRSAVPAVVTLRASHISVVDRFREAP
jgi:Flp pilus assembly protein TadG